MCLFVLQDCGVLLGRVMYLLLLKLVVTVPISPTESSDAFIARGRYEPGVHTINNANPYQGVTVTEGHGKYPVIFETTSGMCKPADRPIKLLPLSTLLLTWSISNNLKDT